MQANPSNFQAIIIQHGQTQTPVHLDVSGIDVPIQPSVILLGVDIDYNLKFNTHISKICWKAGMQQNVVSRLSNYLDIQNITILYNTITMHNFFIQNVVAFLQPLEHGKMEKINKMALRMVFNDYTSSYEDLLVKIGRPMLYAMRLRTICIETFKAVNNLNSAFIS